MSDQESAATRRAQHVIACVKDDRGYLHAPDDEGATRAVCGIEGEYVERPATWAGMWCTTCAHDCVNSKGERLWPVVSAVSVPRARVPEPAKEDE